MVVRISKEQTHYVKRLAQNAEYLKFILADSIVLMKNKAVE